MRSKPLPAKRLLLSLLALPLLAAMATAAPASVKFTPSSESVEVYDFLEIRIDVDKPDAANPFTDVQVDGEFQHQGQTPLRVDGFCDSADGRTFKIRFMPSRPGTHRYSILYKQGDFERRSQGEFTAIDGKRKGLIRVDRDHPWHFIWEGAGEHYFWNGTTTYWLLGWDDDVIKSSIDRLHQLKVNRLRVAINGRVKDGRAWFENVFPTDKFTFLLNPWKAERPNSVENPGFDVKSFNPAHWQKIERMLEYARARDMVISIIFYVDGARPGVDPFGKSKMGGEDEQRYYRYAAARLSPFSNVMWDVTNEYQLFRTEDWVNKMGPLLSQWDPYDHVMSVHGHGSFPFRLEAWADFAMYQSWDESGGYQFMLRNREEQARLNRPIPQINEEYGYEDHYPTWGGGRTAPGRSADNRRRLAWGMYMAGGYQTTGERADQGVGWGADTGGGWLNGRGDDAMIMLKGYAHIVDFFRAIPWWELEPDPALAKFRAEPSATTELTRLLYSRGKDGNAHVFIDDKLAAKQVVSGDFSPWNDAFHLMLGNEATGDRPWRGQIHRVAIYDSALSPDQLAANPPQPLALYTFSAANGKDIRNEAPSGSDLDLRIEKGDVQWLKGGGIELRSPVMIRTVKPAKELTAKLKASSAISILAWIRPASSDQKGPARIVSLSPDPNQRNFTLGQNGRAFEVRLRTTTTSVNGEPAVLTPGAESPVQYVAALRSTKGDLAIIYFAAGGEASVDMSRLGGVKNARWFNPRRGGWSDLRLPANGVVKAPDQEDWVLLLR